MKYGIISDIHGNLEALMTCLSYLRERVSFYIFAGDIVGYGPYPNECVDVVRELEASHSSHDKVIVIGGNHDFAAAGLKDISLFNPEARKAILWTREILSPENKEYLSHLKPRIDTPDFTVAHGSPRDPVDEYLIDELAMKENLSCFEASPCFIGHSHLPLYYGLCPPSSSGSLSFGSWRKIALRVLAEDCPSGSGGSAILRVLAEACPSCSSGGGLSSGSWRRRGRPVRQPVRQSFGGGSFSGGKELKLLADEEEFNLNGRGKVIINPGSVGQPRDRNPMASFGIYDKEKNKISIKRLIYDIHKTQDAMFKEGLPPFLIERLAFGI